MKISRKLKNDIHLQQTWKGLFAKNNECPYLFVAWVSFKRLQERIKQKRLEREEQEKKEQLEREKSRRKTGKELIDIKQR